jgi:hypothetical protein
LTTVGLEETALSMTTLKTKKGQVREGLRLHESLNFKVKELILKKSHNRGFKVLERRKSGDKVRLLFKKKTRKLKSKLNWYKKGNDFKEEI